MTDKCVVVHSGARDSYQVALALQQKNMLESLVTDFYFPGFVRKIWPSQANKRYCEGVPYSKTSLTFEALYYSARTAISDNFTFNQKKDAALSRQAFRKVISTNSNLLAYSYYGYEAFSLLNNEGSEAKKILFQLHPHPFSVQKLLKEELERVPQAAASIFYENEMQYTPDYLDKLSEESMLADAIIVASTYTMNTLIENGVAIDKIKVIPYGIDNVNLLNLPKNKAKGKLRFIFVGSMIQRKGLYDLLEAFSTLSSSHVELILCGRGFIDHELINKYKCDNLILKINLSREDLLYELEISDVFVLPSISEGFAQVILEAMGSGLPVITTTHTCGPDIIENGIEGFVIEPRNIEALRSKMEWCLDNKRILSEMGEHAKKKSSTYTWQRFHREVVSYYNQTTS